MTRISAEHTTDYVWAIDIATCHLNAIKILNERQELASPRDPSTDVKWAPSGYTTFYFSITQSAWM